MLKYEKFCYNQHCQFHYLTIYNNILIRFMKSTSRKKMGHICHQITITINPKLDGELLDGRGVAVWHLHFS